MGTIAEKLQKVLKSKKEIEASITKKGGSVPAGAPFGKYSYYIETLPSGGSIPKVIFSQDGSVKLNVKAAKEVVLYMRPVQTSVEFVTSGSVEKNS